LAGLLITLALGSLTVWLWPAMFGHVRGSAAFIGSAAVQPVADGPGHDPAPAAERRGGGHARAGDQPVDRPLAVDALAAIARRQPEVRAQGLSNIVGGFFSGYLSAGSFTRSGLSYEAGACSPLAGVFSALWVALFACLARH
jgi:SulP family sulfate permease